MEKEMFMNAGDMMLPSSSPAMLNWVSMETHPLDQTLTPDLSSDCFFLEKSTELSIFDSALSSLVSSPTPSNSNFSGGDSFVIGELIGKLGHFGYDSREIYGSDSCYATPISSPTQKMVTKTSTPLAEFSGDPGFAERAAKFSCFGSQSFNGRTNSPFPFNNGPVATEKLPRVSSSRSFNGRTNLPFPVHNGHVATETSNGKLTRVSSTPALKPSQIPPGEVSRKRKAKSKEIEEKEDYDTNRSKRTEENEEKTKELDPYKDFIHVRARRGQATDSHSLAERVRREKISERMKLLQDLVPGCNKVTGKALMLEEIINYVQSLQRQVEFLSMKLSSVNTMLDFNMDSLMSKDMLSSSNNLMNHQILPLESNNIMETSETRSFVSHLPSHFTDSISQYSTFCEDDIRSIIHGSNQVQRLSL